MTREQAIEILRKGKYKPGMFDGPFALSLASDDIDIYVALGMLKLDEPKSRDEKVRDAMKSALGVFLTWQELTRIDTEMAKSGLRIVEK